MFYVVDLRARVLGALPDRRCLLSVSVASVSPFPILAGRQQQLERRTSAAPVRSAARDGPNRIRLSVVARLEVRAAASIALAAPVPCGRAYCLSIPGRSRRFEVGVTITDSKESSEHNSGCTMRN